MIMHGEPLLTVEQLLNPKNSLTNGNMRSEGQTYVHCALLQLAFEHEPGSILRFRSDCGTCHLRPQRPAHAGATLNGNGAPGRRGRCVRALADFG